MEVNPTLLLKELVNQASFVGGEVVEDDVDLLLGRALSDNLFEEINEVLTCVASCGFAVHAASGCFQSGVPR